MKKYMVLLAALFAGFLFAGDLALPRGMEYSDDRPFVEENKQRTRICLNGMWRFLPTAGAALTDAIPAEGSGWGFAKVPGQWSGGMNPTVSPELLKVRDKWHSAWYRRMFTVPEAAKGRRVILELEHVQTQATVFVNGVKAGEIHFPGGEVDLTPLIRFGEKQSLAVRVCAIPPGTDDFIIMDTNNIFKAASKVEIKGITGDAFLHLVPASRVTDVHYITSVAKKKMTFDTGLTGLDPERRYRLAAEIADRNWKPVKLFKSRVFSGKECRDGRITFDASWPGAELWDTHTPENIYRGRMTLTAEDGAPIDETLPEAFGFREFGIEGQNYMLNGKIIHLRAYDLRNYSNPWRACQSSFDAGLRTFARLREMGFNFSIGFVYRYREGTNGYMRDFFRAADRFGWLHSLALPHPKQFDNKLGESANQAKYKAMAGYLIRKYQNHPSLILYASTHNCTGAWGDQDPMKLGKPYVPAGEAGERTLKELNRDNAKIANAIASAIDPSRPVYVHASGDLNGHYTLNMYLNWAPKQERSDWLEEYAKNGKMPLSFVELGLPHFASFSSNRGPGFVWQSPEKQTVWDAEYIAAVRGDRAAEWTRDRIPVLDTLCKNGDQPIHFGRLSAAGEHMKEVIALQADFFADNFRCMRAWNLGLVLPWDDYSFYDKRRGDFPSLPNPDAGKNLNRPGIVPDSLGHDRNYPLSVYSDFAKPSPVGEVLKTWGADLIGFIGGGRVFTTKEHIFRPWETVEKTLVILNDKREPVECRYLVRLHQRLATGSVRIEPGKKALVPIRLALPNYRQPTQETMTAEFFFSDGTRRQDSFRLDILPIGPKTQLPEVALFDPKGDTGKLLNSLGVKFRSVAADDPLTGVKALVIGRRAIDGSNPLPSLKSVRDGMNVLVFEQSGAGLNRLGFRTNEHGLRQLFIRDASHPVLAGLARDDYFADWRGDGTLLPGDLGYHGFFAPTWNWAGFRNTRVWRCGTRGVVANVLIEKPDKGNFFPILDGGFALQYAPLLEYREGKGRILFCQVEVTGRTEPEPAARQLAENLLRDVTADRALPAVARAGYFGGAAFAEELSRRGVAATKNDRNAPLLIAAGGETLPNLEPEVRRGANLFCFGLNLAELKAVLPGCAEAGEVRGQPSRLLGQGGAMLRGISHLDAYFQTRLDYAASGGEEVRSFPLGKGTVTVCAVTPDRLNPEKMFRLRSSYRRRSFLVSQLLRNGGADLPCELTANATARKACVPAGEFYLQTPIQQDDPYRYYHW